MFIHIAIVTMAYNSISHATIIYNRLIVCARYSCNFSFPLKFQLKEGVCYDMHNMHNSALACVAARFRK